MHSVRANAGPRQRAPLLWFCWRSGLGFDRGRYDHGLRRGGPGFERSTVKQYVCGLGPLQQEGCQQAAVRLRVVEEPVMATVPAAPDHVPARALALAEAVETEVAVVLRGPCNASGRQCTGCSLASPWRTCSHGRSRASACSSSRRRRGRRWRGRSCLASGRDSRHSIAIRYVQLYTLTAVLSSMPVYYAVVVHGFT